MQIFENSIQKHTLGSRKVPQQIYRFSRFGVYWTQTNRQTVYKDLFTNELS